MGQGARFTRDTAVVGHDGRYRAELAKEWSAPLLPQGGVVTAVALRAMAMELGTPVQRLRSISTVFAAQVRSGPVEIDVTMLRRGRSISQMTATVRSPGEDAGHTSIAVFGGPRPGFEFTDVAPPVVPPPDECPSFRDPPPPGFERRVPFPYWDHVEGRVALGNPPWADRVPSTSDRANWYRFDEPPLVDGGLLDPCAVITLCDTMPGAVSERMGPGIPFWLPPSADLTVHLLGDAGPDWILAYNRARFAGDGYASVEMTLWDRERGLVAYATQMMFFSFPDGPPPPDRLRAPTPASSAGSTACPPPSTRSRAG
jgi:acyl-CoA thioesterase